MQTQAQTQLRTERQRPSPPPRRQYYPVIVPASVVARCVVAAMGLSGIHPRLIFTRGRTRPIRIARFLVSYIYVEGLGYGYSRTGRLTGGRDHTTIIYHVQHAKQFLADDPVLAEKIGGIVTTLRSGQKLSMPDPQAPVEAASECGDGRRRKKKPEPLRPEGTSTASHPRPEDHVGHNRSASDYYQRCVEMNRIFLAAMRRHYPERAPA